MEKTNKTFLAIRVSYKAELENLFGDMAFESAKKKLGKAGYYVGTAGFFFPLAKPEEAKPEEAKPEEMPKKVEKIDLFYIGIADDKKREELRKIKEGILEGEPLIREKSVINSCVDKNGVIKFAEIISERMPNENGWL